MTQAEINEQISALKVGQEIRMETNVTLAKKIASKIIKSSKGSEPRFKIFKANWGSHIVVKRIKDK